MEKAYTPGVRENWNDVVSRLSPYMSRYVFASIWVIGFCALNGVFGIVEALYDVNPGIFGFVLHLYLICYVQLDLLVTLGLSLTKVRPSLVILGVVLFVFILLYMVLEGIISIVQWAPISHGAWVALQWIEACVNILTSLFFLILLIPMFVVIILRAGKFFDSPKMNDIYELSPVFWKIFILLILFLIADITNVISCFLYLYSSIPPGIGTILIILIVFSYLLFDLFLVSLKYSRRAVKIKGFSNVETRISMISSLVTFFVFIYIILEFILQVGEYLTQSNSDTLPSDTLTGWFWAEVTINSLAVALMALALIIWIVHVLYAAQMGLMMGDNDQRKEGAEGEGEGGENNEVTPLVTSSKMVDDSRNLSVQDI